MRIPLVAGNWKMHGSLATNLALLQAVRDGVKGPAEVAVCVPYPYLAQARAVLEGGAVAAQHVAELDRIASAGLQLFDLQSIALARAVLLTARLENSVHVMNLRGGPTDGHAK